MVYQFVDVASYAKWWFNLLRQFSNNPKSLGINPRLLILCHK